MLALRGGAAVASWLRHGPRAAAPHPPRRAQTQLTRARFDFKRIVDNADYIARNIEQRKSNGDVSKVVALHEQHGALQARVEGLRSERNSVAKSAALSPEQRQAAGRRLKEELAALEQQLDALKGDLAAAAAQLPCDTHPDAPVGAEPSAALVGTYGAKPAFAFAPRSHVQLGEALGLFDLSAGAAVAGAGFAVLTGDGVLLELALVQLALTTLAGAGFTPVAPPDVAHARLVEGCGFSPRDTPGGAASQVYSVAGSDLCLLGTSEVPLAALHEDAILERARLPAAYCAVSHCFRREAGGGGARDRGLYRLHQFTKVEMFAFVAPEGGSGEAPGTGGGEAAGGPGPLRRGATGPAHPGDGGAAADAAAAAAPAPAPARGPTRPSPASEAMLARLVGLQIDLFSQLGLHFRVLDMPTQELGAAAYRKFDIEAWMPCRVAAPVSGGGGGGGRDGAAAEEQGAFGEISSASNCLDYQARRLNIRYRAGPKDNRFVHTLNATAVAVPRTLIALLETHQQADGSVAIPPVLQPFMGGRTVLRPHGWRGGAAAGLPVAAASG